MVYSGEKINIMFHSHDTELKKLMLKMYTIS